MQQESKLQSLKHRIDEGKLSEALQLALECGGTATVQLTVSMLQVKNDDAASALVTLNSIQKPVPQELSECYRQVWLYVNYRLGNFAMVTKECSSKSTSSFDALLVAQSLCKEEKYDEMIDIYLKQEQSDEVMVNMLNGAILSESAPLRERVSKSTQDYVRRQKGQVSREVLLNSAILSVLMGDSQGGRDTLNRIINLVRLDSMDVDSDEDYLMASLIIDYIDQKSLNREERLKYYTHLLASTTLPKHLIPIILNNLACIQENLHHNHSETLKRLDESLELLLNGKNYPSQLTWVKINRVLIQYSRNRMSDGLRHFKEIESLSNPFMNHLLKMVYNLKQNQPLHLQEVLKLCPNALTQVYVVLLALQDHPENATSFIAEYLRPLLPTWASHKPLVLLTLATMMKYKQENHILIQDIHEQGHLPDLASYWLSLNQVEQAISIHKSLVELNHQSAQVIQGKIALKYIELDNWEKAINYLDQVQMPFSVTTDVAELERLEINVQLTKVTRSKSQEIQVTKTIKKQHRSRRPKGLALDAPPPNPERWLPKQERKDYRKRKGAIMKSRTQGSSQVVNKETMSTFNRGATSANVDVSSKQSKNRKKKH